MDEVQTERELTGGTIEGLSVDSSATIEFRDGTAVTISGLTTLTISDDGQKELHLGSGNLSAAVMEQQRGMPLLVETPAATLVVLGTQFDVTADQMRTEITVNKGHVRATRLTDGKALEIYAGHRAVASIEVRDDWRALEIEHGGHTWQADLMNDTTHGKWLSATTALKLELRLAMKAGIMTEDQAKQEFYRKVGDLDKNDGFVQALPMRLSDDVVYFVAVDVRADSGGVVLDERNRFRIQGRVKQSIEVQFGFSAIDRNSDAGGRHMKSLTQRKVEKTFDIVMPVDQFPVWNDKYTSPVGRDLVNVFCFTSSRDAELEITNVELLAD
jgi:hypothetical protein